MTTTLNKSAVRAHALAVSCELKRGRVSRVSEAYLRDLDRRVREWIEEDVRRECGRTLKP